MSIASRERRGSPLKAIARNALILSLEERFSPKDERFYDGYASLEIWLAIRGGKFEEVKFYVENCYDTTTAIFEGSKKYTLTELAICAQQRYDGKSFNNNIGKIVRYLEKRVTISNDRSPRFSILPEELNPQPQLEAQYVSQDYVCKFVRKDKQLKILELFESNFEGEE
ncbi:MAG: hypothetical protein KGH53_03040 [Candidatus Micrarchaeota archaeon]|nr:hypothetical protein [Candidatus Micrarchaeota archaeon]